MSIEENFADYMQEKLYGEQGFYTLGNGAGRSRDYMTSPEVGDLFGFVIANYIDNWYENLETDGPAIVLEVGSGPGSLAASIARANMRNSKNINYHLVDISPAHRETTTKLLNTVRPEFEWSTNETIPYCEYPTLVIANELFDNLIFDISTVEEIYRPYDPQRRDVHVAMSYLGVFGDIDRLENANLPTGLQNFRIPVHIGIAEFMQELASATSEVSSLSVLFFDYMKKVEDMQDEKWLRLYTENQKVVGVDTVLKALELGQSGDITTDVTIQDMHLLLDQNGFSKIRYTTQKEWLQNQNIDVYLPKTEPINLYEQAQAFTNKEKNSQTKGFALEKQTLLDETALGAFGVFEAVREI